MSLEIIAEIAQGYEGDPKLTELLVNGAIASNADSIKLQLVFADELCVPTYPYFKLFRSLEMDESVWSKIVSIVHNNEKNIYFDIYGNKSLDLAIKLGADGVKISTTDFYNQALIKKAFKNFKNVFVSIGGVPIEDVDSLVNDNILPNKLTLMHGFQAEPTIISDNNLARINTLKNRFPNLNIGFMDHSLGDSDEAFYLPVLALGFGISCIEKHISLDYSLKIEDYVSALSIDRFKFFVEKIKSLKLAIGSKELILNKKEIEYKNRAGKVAVSKINLMKDHVIRENDIELKRVSTTFSKLYVKKTNDLIGKILNENIKINEPFKLSNLK